MARARSTTTIRPRVWIPPTYSALYKIEVERDDGTKDDITDICEGEFTDGATDTIGSFDFTVDNSNETYTDVWTGNETLKVYINYALTATTARFRGIIEKVSKQDNDVRITGRGESLKLLDVTVTKSYSDTETSVILKDLFDNYATDFTYTNVNTSTKSITVNWYEKPLFECIQELCYAASFDFYIDSSLDAHYFESETINNKTEAVVHGSNILEVGDFAEDLSLIKNKVIVYGADINDLPLFKTAQDSSSISTYGEKKLKIKDENITTETQCQERADYELSLNKDPPVVGEVKCVGLATIQPGQRIRISAPESGLNPGYYKVISYTHRFEGFHETILKINKEPRKIHHTMKDRISNEQKLSETPNANEMDYSWNLDFDSDSGTHSSTEIIGGVLKLQSEAEIGNWVSEITSRSSNISSFELRVKGEGYANILESENVNGTRYEISVDGGISYTTVSSLNTPQSISGKKIRIKVTLNNSDTQIDSIALLYK